MNNFWGKELVLDCYSGDVSTFSRDNIAQFIRALVSSIHMEAYGEPMIEHFANHDPEKSGFSFCQMITTSAITGHFVDLNGNFYINIFSCQDFDRYKTEEIVNMFFAPESIHSRVLYRGE